MLASSRFLALVLALALMLYPILMYFGIREFGPRILAIVLLVAAVIKLVVTRLARQALGNSTWLLLAAAIASSLTLITGSVIGLKFYPVLVNVVLLCVFGVSLWKPPSMIERFARLQTPDLPIQAIAYTRKVTWVWCVFFLFNSTIAAVTVFASDKTWALYNGLLSYIFIGVLLAGEYLVRLRVQKQHAQVSHHSTKIINIGNQPVADLTDQNLKEHKITE